MAATNRNEDTGSRTGSPAVAMPPAPPGESSPAAVDRTRAVCEALAQLGDEADAAQVADHVHATWGLTLSADDIETIRRELCSRAQPAPPTPGGAASRKGGGS